MDLRGELGAAEREVVLCVRCMRSGVLLYEGGACRRVEGVRGSADGCAAADMAGLAYQSSFIRRHLDWRYRWLLRYG